MMTQPQKPAISSQSYAIPSRRIWPLSRTFQQDTGRTFPPSIRQIALLHVQEFLYRSGDDVRGPQARFLQQAHARIRRRDTPAGDTQLIHLFRGYYSGGLLKKVQRDIGAKPIAMEHGEPLCHVK